MRTIQTIILRLLIDTDRPLALRGTLNAVSENQMYQFTDEQSLLALLHHLGSSGRKTAGNGEHQDEPVEIDTKPNF